MLSLRMLAIAGIMVAWTGLVFGAESTPLELLGKKKGFDMAHIETIGGAEAKVVQTDKGQVLRVTIPKAADKVGVKFLPPEGHWDFSKLVSFTLHIGNPGTQQVTVDTKVNNPQVVDNIGWNGTTTSVAPGDTTEDWITLRRKKPDWIKVELSGMRGYPWGMSLTRQKPGDPLMDPSNIVSITMCVENAVEGQVFDVCDMTVGGVLYVPAEITEKLKDPALFFPFIDQFGQYIHREWPGKTHSLEDLAAARKAEAKDLADHPGPSDWDQYGGWKSGPTLKANGFFYVTKHEGKWWFVDPEGKLFFSAGMNCVQDSETTPLVGREKWFKDMPAKDSDLAVCYGFGGRGGGGFAGGRRGASAPASRSGSPTSFDFGRANIMRKYGPNWQEAFYPVTHQRLRSWGINTIANWSSAAIYGQDKTPYVTSLRTGGVRLAASESMWGRFPDVFDAGFKEGIIRGASRMSATFNDPWCIGYFVDNELGWTRDNYSLAVITLACPADQPAKKAFIEDLKAKYGDIAKLNAAWGANHASWEQFAQATAEPDLVKARADLEAFHAKTADTYFRLVKEAVKQLAPQHLYLGCRFAPLNPPVVAAAAKYCDVVSINIYYRTSLDEYEMPVKEDVPVICTEFHYGAIDRGPFHSGLTPVADQAARAAAYKEFLQSALRNPRFVGCHWFQYRDQCTTGRPGDEECYQIGFVDTADTPYPETVQAAREIGAMMYPYRLSGK